MTTVDPPAITIPLHAWEVDPQVGVARLHTRIDLNGVHMHLEAWQVHTRRGVQVGVGRWAADLDLLGQIYDGDGPFATTSIHGRRYVLVAFPHIP
jgi:hypothetical protein